MFEAPVVESPCINVCRMNTATSYCHGCYRTLEEIQGWCDYTFAQKADILKKTWVRQEAVFD